jgi:hypothetical protein
MEYEEQKEIFIDGTKQRIPYKIYLEDFKTLFHTEETIFNVSGSHIKQFDREMYYQFIYFPAEMISCFDLTIKNMFQRLYIDS